MQQERERAREVEQRAYQRDPATDQREGTSNQRALVLRGSWTKEAGYE